MSRAFLSRRARHAQRGTTLVESLLAFVALGASALAIGHLQSQLRLAGDVARERSEAVRLGEAEIENLRAWSVPEAASGSSSYAAIDDGHHVVDRSSGYAGHAVYDVVRRIDATTFTALKAAAVDVTWRDRSGAAQGIALGSALGAVAPAYAAALALGAGAIPAATRGAFGRAPSVPADAVSIDHGRSARKPAATATTALIYDDASGDVVAQCSGIAAARATRELTAADLGHCRAGRWLTVGGTIRFSAASPPSPAEARDPPLPMSVELSLAGGDASAAPACDAMPMKSVRYRVGRSVRIDAVAIDASPSSLGLNTWEDTGDRYTAWQCLVVPRADGRWSGRVSLVGGVGVVLGTTPTAHRVCRFSADADGSGAVDTNLEHPRDYRDVGAALMGQNFLVVRGSEACPAERGLVQHQP